MQAGTALRCRTHSRRNGTTDARVAWGRCTPTWSGARHARPESRAHARHQLLCMAYTLGSVRVRETQRLGLVRTHDHAGTKFAHQPRSARPQLRDPRAHVCALALSKIINSAPTANAPSRQTRVEPGPRSGDAATWRVSSARDTASGPRQVWCGSVRSRLGLLGLAQAEGTLSGLARSNHACGRGDRQEQRLCDDSGSRC